MRPISTRKPCTTPRRPRQAMTCMRSMTNGCRGGTTWASPNSKALPGPSSASARNGTNANHYADPLLYAGKRPCLLTRMFACGHAHLPTGLRSEEHTSELQSLMRISYAVFCLKKKQNNTTYQHYII